jgi:hypothetical protein
MSNVHHYHDDGANRQAQAVLALFQYFLGDGIEGSWSEQFSKYEADIHVSRWENRREQGYVLYMRTADHKHQLNIAFYEHRNCDNIDAARWEQTTWNAPCLTTPDTEGEQNYNYGWENAKSFSYCKIEEAARWIHEEFEKFWHEHSNKA